MSCFAFDKAIDLINLFENPFAITASLVILSIVLFLLFTLPIPFLLSLKH
jgi:hypothetical protein